MKKFFYLPFAIVVLVGVLSIGAQAQSSGAQRLLANIPFSFSVGKVTLPAGKYTITVVNPSSDQRVLLLRSADGRSSAVVLTTGVIGTASENSKLVFDRYGDRYFFAQAHMAGDETSLAAVKSSAEKAERRMVAKTNKKTVVEITVE